MSGGSCDTQRLNIYSDSNKNIAMSVEHIQKSVKNVIAYLNESPQDGLCNDPPITAVVEDGLRCRATAENGETIVTDMPDAIGGGGSIGLDDAVSAGPLSVRTQVTIGAAGVS